MPFHVIPLNKMRNSVSRCLQRKCGAEDSGLIQQRKRRKKGNKETILISKMRSRAQHIYQWINMVKGQKYILISLEEDLVYISANLLSAVYVKHNVI